MSERVAPSGSRPQTRYRVTGTLFLIALAVIFVPMLFDGAGKPTQVIPAVPGAAKDSAIARFDDVVPASDVVARVEALRNEVDEAGFMTDSDTLLGEPILAPVTERTRVWAVQAASFASTTNAQNFRSDLRAAGYEAFISTTRQTDGDKEVLYRVAVGPYLAMTDVESALQTIAQTFNVEPQIMALSQ
jgi:DedD protein